MNKPEIPNPARKGAEAIKSRYNKVAPFFDLAVRLGGGRHLKQWRDILWSKIEGTSILEIGVGTGASFPYYPPGTEVTAIDLSQHMLEIAQKKASAQNIKVRLEEMDVQDLRFADNTFDTVTASLVFCEVPDPIRGLREMKRVCKPGGKIVLLEHVLSSSHILRSLQNLFNPVTVWLLADNINRRTAENVARSGLTVEKLTDFSSVFQLIESRKKKLDSFPLYGFPQSS